MKKYYVYILRSLKDNKRYIGSTNNIEKRIKEHNQGLVKSTKFRRPFIIEHLLEYDTLTKARIMERKFKKSVGTLIREIKNQSLKTERSSDG